MSDESLDLANRLALRPKEAAEALGVSERTMRKWMRDAGLPHLQLDAVVCIPVAELREWMVERMASSRRTDEIAEKILRDL